MFGAARKWIYPASVDGVYQTRHRIISRSLIAFLLIAPWVRIGGNPLLLADLPARQVHVLTMLFTPRDTTVLLTALLSAGLVLFLVTALWGRLWCGYGCPQTVLMEELVRRIERWVEGERGAQMKLSAARFDATKLRKRITKWFLFLVFATVIGGSFTGFFVDIYAMIGGRASAGAYAFAAVIIAMIYVDFAWFREQFCHYLCPYARFQSVLTDDHTVNIGYDFRRGEPRKARGLKMSDLGVGAGDCVDCGRCVTVCPSGIDIRNGYQLECVACARCVDACTEVMGRLNKPTLVLYASQAALEGRPTKLFGTRPRIYAAVLVGVLVAFFVTVGSRTAFDLTIAQDARSAETLLEGGAVRNLYQLTLHNNASQAASFEVEVTLAGADLVIPGAADGAHALDVEAAGRRVVPAFVTMPSAADMPTVSQFEFIVRSGDDEVRHRAIFRNSQRTGTK